MSLVLLGVLAGLAVGRLCGGSLDGLARLRVRDRRLVLLALVVQAAGGLLTGPLGPAAYAAGLAGSALLAAVFLLRNRGLAGTGLVGLGLAANALVVGANGAMPVSPDAAARAGVGLGAVLVGDDPRHEVLDAATRLPLLADVVPVPLPGARQVVSPGDVLVTAGLAQLLVVGMRTGRTPRRGVTTAGPGGPTVSRTARGDRETST